MPLMVKAVVESTFTSNPGRNLIINEMGIAQSEDQVLFLRLNTISNTIDFKLLAETVVTLQPCSSKGFASDHALLETLARHCHE